MQQVSAQALMSLLQTLGKPLSGTVLPGSSGTHVAGPNMGSTSSTLALQLTLPQAAGPGQPIATSLTLPNGAQRPGVGAPVLVQAEGTGAGARLAITVTGPPPLSSQGLRADAVRQASLAPLVADLARSMGQAMQASSQAKAVDNAISRLMGFVLNADSPMDGPALRLMTEGARGAAPTGNGSASASHLANPFSGQPGMQGALAALIRALGLSLPSINSASGHASTGNSAASGATVPQPAAGQPSRLPSAPVFSDPLDLVDPDQLQALKTKAEGALSRLNLLQAQDLGPQGRGGDALSALRWDVPLLIGQEAALLGVAIEKDGQGDKQREKKANRWRFRFAFQSVSLGGIEGMVALQVQPAHSDQNAPPLAHLDIAVWATERHVLARLDATRAALVGRLQALGLAVDSLSVAPVEVMAAPKMDLRQQTHHVDVTS